MPKLREEFTEDNVLSLSLGCADAAKRTKEAYDDGIDSIIVPSRGACPIIRGIIYAIKTYAAHGKDKDEYIKLYESLNLPYFLRVEYGIGNRGKVKNGRDINIIPYPLTADVSAPKALLNDYGITLDYLTDSIRKYGADVIGSIRLDKEERRKSDKFNFLTFIFEDVEGRKEEAEFYRELPRIEYPLIVDTVISGRSLSTITKNLNQYFEKFGFIGIVDANGSKLKPEYLQTLSSFGNGELISVDRILSEDRGASLLGVMAFIYPNLALEAQREFDIRPCGAVTWRHIPSDSKNSKISKEMKERFNIYNEVFKNYIGAIYDGIDLLVRSNPEKDTEYRMREKIDRVVNLIEEHGLLHHEEFLDPNAFVRDGIEIEDIYESSSHVIHILFSERGLEDCLNIFRKKYKSNSSTKRK